MDNVALICYYDGVLQHGTRDNPIYVGGHTRAARVWKNISFTEFVIKMQELCKVPSDQTTIDIRCRYLLDQHTSIAMRVEDDDSLSLIMDLHPDQCNAIVVYVEKLPCQKSNTTTQRHARGSSSVNAGGLDYMASKAVEVNINQLTSNSYDKSDSLVIDMYSRQSKNSSSLPRSPDQGLKRFINLTKQFCRNDTVQFGTFNARPNSWFGMRILDPKDPYLQKWNRIFVLSCMLALALDALFFYSPGIDGQMSCLTRDKNLEIVTSVLRSITDVVYVLHIIFQFRTGFFVISSRIVGSGEFVQDLGVIARRYLCSYFLVDILSVLPLPQVLTLIMPRMSGLIDVRKTNSLHYVVLLQYIPRSLRAYLLYKEVRIMSTMIISAWAGAFFNFSLYVLASHIYGALWYFFAVEREYICLRGACSNTTTCNLSSLYCRVQSTGGYGYLEAKCPIIEPNKTLFDFGIYLDALQSGILKSSFPKKLMYCFWWGLQNLGSFGQNLKTSAYIWEVCFAASMSVFGLFLFMLLIGNVQIYLQSDTLKSEKEFRKKIQDTEQWMSRKFLSEDLRQRIRQYELCIWQTTRGFNEESYLRNLPKDIKRDIKRYCCLPLLMEVPMFEKMDEQLLDAMCDRLKPVLYTENCFIIREGDPVDDMLFIMRGKLLTMTTNGGTTGFLNSNYLKAGDFCGEELLTWALVPHPSSNLPISTRTVRALSEVEAFALTADDLKFVASQFRRLHSKQLRHTFRFHSQHWRTWAACFIQAAWRRYCRKKLEESLSEEENRLKDALAQTGGSPPSLGATIYASRFAANILRTIRPSGSRKARLLDRLPPIILQKPDEPDFFC